MKKRYAGSFLLIGCLLVLLFWWNVASGSVEISVPELIEILKRTSLESYGAADHLADPPAQSPFGNAFRWGTVCLRFSAPELFSKSDRRSVRAGNFFRSKTGSGVDDDLFTPTEENDQFGGNGRRSIYWFTARHGICADHLFSGI